MKQRTLLREVSIKGKSLHTGEAVTMSLKPAPENHGIVFRRLDIYGKPTIKPMIDHVDDLVRSTTVADGHAKVHTVEHVLSALNGCSVDNVLIEMDASEPPIMDGSAKHFVNAIQEAEPVEQDAEKEFFVLNESVSVTKGNSSIIALPYDGFKITCTSSDDRGVHTQHLSIDIDIESYITHISAARTFTVYEDIEELLNLGKIKGGSLESAIVIKGDKILSKEPLRYKDEFVRHKILDIIGDIVLLGMPLKAHIIAVRPSHALNAQLTKKIWELQSAPTESVKKTKPILTNTEAPSGFNLTESSMDIRSVMDVLPHRYPFLMIDRVIEIIDDKELVAIKNLSINEPFFQGHYPGMPVMPGVLQIEAMAQAVGVLLLKLCPIDESKVALFMSANNVKFRRAVTPGDTLEIRVKIIKLKANKLATAECKCFVSGNAVSQGELMFSIVDT
ncbi:MAG: 3-hydroxyacyl-[acyl-carrier-protein] dehydratase FabZ [Puniceicoccaceae bacterium]|nr:3-hydroxyacyl-[acyl-carrier-protein] dehydratase FabZ [Puniceicoccaceae bacterium]RCL30918.1 MAG: bifunctional UDP-3-O-[3-hydroxymyristoyl] N-acetylglucosamine deacetylase/3-hydroxyacyl-ACP dehydratase [Puniceicoccaceae bacterium]